MAETAVGTGDLRRQCKMCGKEFRPRKRFDRKTDQSFCNRKCAGEARRLLPRQCPKCRKEFEPVTTKQSFCGKECAYKARTTKLQPRQCKQCRREFMPRKKHSSFCDRGCVNAARTKLQPQRCKQCGKAFKPRDARQSLCDRACADKARRVATPSRDRSTAARARKFNVPHEAINPLKVFERDNWRCQICMVRTPLRLRGTRDPRAPELDHRIPMSKGGGHTWSNVQCACRKCNRKKSNKKVLGQLPIFERLTAVPGRSSAVQQGL